MPSADTRTKNYAALLRKRGYRVLELYYDSYTDKKRDQLYYEILDCLHGFPITGSQIRLYGSNYT